MIKPLFPALLRMLPGELQPLALVTPLDLRGTPLAQPVGKVQYTASRCQSCLSCCLGCCSSLSNAPLASSARWRSGPAVRIFTSFHLLRPCLLRRVLRVAAFGVQVAYLPDASLIFCARCGCCSTSWSYPQATAYYTLRCVHVCSLSECYHRPARHHPSPRRRRCRRSVPQRSRTSLEPTQECLA